MVVNNGFQKVDITTGDINFEWWALDHVSLTESMISLPSMPNSVDTAWDFLYVSLRAYGVPVPATEYSSVT